MTAFVIQVQLSSERQWTNPEIAAIKQCFAATAYKTADAIDMIWGKDSVEVEVEE